MADDKLRDDRLRASRAQSLVSDELLIEAFAILKTAYIDAWQVTSPSDEQAREKLYIAVNVIGKVKEQLDLVIANGRLAEAELKRLTDDAERKRLFARR